MDKYLFSIDSRLNKELNDVFDNHSWEIRQVMRELFGDILMSHVRDDNMDRIYDIVAFITTKVCSKTENHYIGESFTQAQQASVNVLNAALAGAALKTGE